MLYRRPATRSEALETLTTDGARVLVGGTDLLVGIRHHIVAPSVLVDIKDVVDLPAPVIVDDDGITVGPTMTMAALAAHLRVRQWFPALVEAASSVGSVAIRNRASLIGNACHGSPAADTAPALLAHGASITVSGTDGDRTTSVADFFLGPRRTLCAPGELVISIHVPRPAIGSGSACRRMTRRRGVDLATVSVAAHVDRDGRITVGFGAVGPKPLLARRDQPLDVDDADALNAAVEELVGVATPISDVRAGQVYRAQMLRVLTRRTVITAATRRGEKGLR